MCQYAFLIFQKCQNSPTKRQKLPQADCFLAGEKFGICLIQVVQRASVVSVFDFVVSRIPNINSITPFEYVFVIDGISAHEIKIDFILFSLPRTLRSVSNLYSDWPEGVSTHKFYWPKIIETDTLQASWSFFEEFEAVEI